MTRVSDAPGEAGPASGGLTALDRDRAASLADEGGTSAAVVESQEASAPVARRGKGWLVASFALGCFAAWRLSRRG